MFTQNQLSPAGFLGELASLKKKNRKNIYLGAGKNNVFSSFCSFDVGSSFLSLSLPPHLKFNLLLQWGA